ncbi:hypothetical protein [Acetobacter conturbans]|uniref:Uncharacterized protein n=1 Tax=Acetobacter conturbans TaxID=1737472 RepID=A0ABX0K2E6_9PROT|nr:hypothetical protein [Acetobacter conturbans]NHN89846.1 hypothetical protein [Acetobacter conturbans]
MSEPDEPREPQVANALVSSSGLVRWLHQHRAELHQRQQAGRISWRMLADVLEQQGVKDDAGKPASADAIRRAWYRIRKKLLEVPSPAPAPVAATRPRAEIGLHNTEKETVLHNPKPTPEPAPAPAEQAPAFPEQRTRPRRALATLRGATPAAPAPAPSSGSASAAPPKDDQQTVDPDAVLRDAGFNF